MPETCTCGTLLVEGARFCHRCGRPTFEEPVVEPAEPIQTAPPPLPVQTIQEKLAQLPVNFGNPIALRVAFLMSLGVMLMQLVPFLNLLFVVWWLLAGWGAVRLYGRLTGSTLSVRAGARLGSITGVLAFVSMAIVTALTLAFAGRQMFDDMVKQDPRMSDVVNNPPMLAAVLLVVLAVIFVLVVGICAAGGALGARFSARRAHG
jgi:hypothetical protein